MSVRLPITVRCNPFAPKTKDKVAEMAIPAGTTTSDYEMGDTDILMICRENTAGVFASLCQGINKYTGYKARFVETSGTYLNYPKDLYLGDRVNLKDKLRELALMVKNCKVMHWNQVHWSQRGKIYADFGFDFAPYMAGKIHTCHERGTILRMRSHLPNNYRCIFLSTPDLLFYCPEGFFLPNPIHVPFDDIKITYPTPKHVIQCPTLFDTIEQYMASIRNVGAYPDYFPPGSTVKSTALFHDAMERISHKSGITYAIHKGIDFKTCIHYKSSCSFYFDEMFAGSYGMNTIEALYLRKPVMARLSDHSRKKFAEWSGDECPVLQVELKTLEDDITRHLKLDEKKIGIESKSWVLKMHNQKKVCKTFVEEALG